MTINLAQQIIAAERVTGAPDLDAAIRVVITEPRFSFREAFAAFIRSTATSGLRLADRLDPELELAA